MAPTQSTPEATWTACSTRDASELVGLPESAIRSCVRAGFLEIEPSRFPLRFSFRELKLLRAVSALVSEGVSLSRVRRQLAALKQRLGNAPLAELTLSSHAGQVIVRERELIWRADSGQLIFDFVLTTPPGVLTALPVRREAVAPEPIALRSADEWLDQASMLEEVDVTAAVAAYGRALKLRPDCSEGWINMGRLLAESGESERATHCFERALELNPRDATALYNLGVVAQDSSCDERAIELYRRALELEPTLAEAHYNLATLFDRGGDARAAIRHINEYRKLTRTR